MILKEIQTCSKMQKLPKFLLNFNSICKRRKMSGVIDNISEG